MVRVGDQVALPDAPGIENAQAQIDCCARERYHPGFGRHLRWLVHESLSPESKGSITRHHLVLNETGSEAEAPAGKFARLPSCVPGVAILTDAISHSSSGNCASQNFKVALSRPSRNQTGSLRLPERASQGRWHTVTIWQTVNPRSLSA